MKSKSPFGMAKFQGARSQFLFTFPSFPNLDHYMYVSKNSGFPPKSSILIGFSTIKNHPFWGPTPIFWKTPTSSLTTFQGFPLFLKGGVAPPPRVSPNGGQVCAVQIRDLRCAYGMPRKSWNLRIGMWIWLGRDMHWCFISIDFKKALLNIFSLLMSLL